MVSLRWCSAGTCPYRFTARYSGCFCSPNFRLTVRKVNGRRASAKYNIGLYVELDVKLPNRVKPSSAVIGTPALEGCDSLSRQRPLRKGRAAGQKMAAQKNGGALRRRQV